MKPPVRRACWLWLVVVTVGVLSLLRTQFRLTVVDGKSMEPTLHDGEWLIVHTRAYSQRAPDRDDIVVARFRGEFLVKRVVGLPGETLEVRRGQVVVDGVPTDSRPPDTRYALELRRGRIGAGYYGLLGDNRTLSSSQQVHASVPREEIIGRVVFRLSLGWRDGTPASG